ncbi:DUF6884 domain-containing protein [Tengunoibacter tsumagoiensis]|uniref:DUF6884 domain-containing protein n=1 Tax=Tengunoibacter tsumagoiensis TaxID=2014871 RepID=A0A402A059_9CHLR|nr:DUF6884 domain-containing protein [Tengunoibacter tsumagoiensis]GCE12493.1 hypothetical protein KTT_23520 [Tengunoibacter tsumagoiensis]
MKRLLLISCSGAKNKSTGTLPAIERYSGGVYQGIKKARREGSWPDETDIVILSAKYGLIFENTPVELYDQKTNQVRAKELQQKVSEALDAILKESRYDQIFINMGKVYMQSITLSLELQQAYQQGIVQEAFGGIGTKLSQTKK